MSERLIAYGAFAAFCLLSSIRDVVTEHFFKSDLYDLSPVFVLFVYCVVTQVFAGAIFMVQLVRATSPQPQLRSAKWELLWLNVFTLTAYTLYFFAIQTPLGSAVNAFVDYGSGPIFTAVVGAVVLKQPLTMKFVWCAAFSFIGLSVLSAPRMYGDPLSLAWTLGLTFAILSSLSSATYRVYFKALLQQGFTKSAIVFLRMTSITALLGAILLLQPHLFRGDHFFSIAIVGVVGFAFPLFLTLSVLQRVSMPRFAMLLFLFPALTLMFSATMGYARVFFTDLLAAAMMLGGVAIYEGWHRTEPKSHGRSES
jgi:drug/metabolite transporter (DMT)-like permease